MKKQMRMDVCKGEMIFQLKKESQKETHKGKDAHLHITFTYYLFFFSRIRQHSLTHSLTRKQLKHGTR